MKRVVAGVIILLLFGGVSYLYPKYQEKYEPPLRLHRLPPTLALEIMSLGNKELMAEIIFYNTEFYFGEKVGWRKETPELRRLYDALDKATDLDPYNMDCYYFAQGTLSWIKPAVPHLNRLLEKGLKYRTWDWYIPFFLAANYYFQLKKPAKAANYLKLASKLAPQNALFATLTARMFYEGNETEAGIAYLKSLIADTQNPILRKKFIRRLKALEAISFLEKAITEFQKKYGHKPKSLDDLVTVGIISHIPSDPYGGRFYLDKNGRVYTTSKLAEGWQKSKNDTNKN